MKSKISFLGWCLLGVLLLSGPALAVPSPSDYCSSKCSAARCYEGCYDQFEGKSSTCAAFLNEFGDFDRDGLVYTSDNCACHANPNQADCDGDGRGDVCDTRNEKWVLVQDLGICRDTDEHAWGWIIERNAVKQYQNVCDNAYCIDHSSIDREGCYAFEAADANDCCDDNFPLSFCTGTKCGTATCPF